MYREGKATLSFENLPPLDIEYDPRSYLPVASARNSIVQSPEMNL